jgi:hypothetical protein
MRFHLNYTPVTSDFKINHASSTFLIGSCFSENIGEKLKDRKFNIRSNPNGNLFNPFSIQTALLQLIQDEKINSKIFLQRDSTYYSFLHHSSVNASAEKELITKINSMTEKSASFLKSCHYLFITFGSACYYHHKTLNCTVANCHKQSALTFEKRLAKTDEIVQEYRSLIKKLNVFNPALKIIFTVSPVKHLKDGVIENNLSKSTLLLAVHQLVSENTNCFYFPAYELVNDDLRDYRFYKEDLAHPNQQAIDYVWDKFSDCYFSPKTKQINEEFYKLQLALNHRKMEENEAESEKLNEFLRKQKEEIKKLAPEIEF